MNNLITAVKKATMKPTNAYFNAHPKLVKNIVVKYRCPTNPDYFLTYSTTEVVPAMYCDGCGKKHAFEPELTPEDLRAIEIIREEVKKNAELLDIIENQAAHDARREIQKGPSWQKVFPKSPTSFGLNPI